MSLRTNFEKELKNLREYLLKMAGIVEEQIELAIISIEKQDEETANKVIDRDDELDDMKLEMENKCIWLTGTQQPLASDLRNIFSTNQIATDLERMGDYAVDIAEIALRLKNEKYLYGLERIQRMAKIVVEMVKGCIDAYIQSDLELAKKVCAMDDEVDLLTGSMFADLFSTTNRGLSETFQVVEFLFVAKYIERIGDHATNVGEWVVFKISGKLEDLNN